MVAVNIFDPIVIILLVYTVLITLVSLFNNPTPSIFLILLTMFVITSYCYYKVNKHEPILMPIDETTYSTPTPTTSYTPTPTTSYTPTPTTSYTTPTTSYTTPTTSYTTPTTSYTATSSPTSSSTSPETFTNLPTI